MTKTFERFLRSFSDEDLRRFAEQRGAARPPYWPTIRLALRIEMSRRGLEPGPPRSDAVATGDPETSTRSISA